MAAAEESTPSTTTATDATANTANGASSPATTPPTSVHESDEFKLGPTPPVKKPYTPDMGNKDLPCVKWALAAFLNSKMVESEEYLDEHDPSKDRLYFASGYGLIQAVKAFMSYEDEDIEDAIKHTKRGNLIANQHRKKAGYGRGWFTSGVDWIKSMTPVERHAELIYGETLFETALLGIVHSGDWLAFIREALHMRTCVNLYRGLWKYLQVVDAEAKARGEEFDASVDVDFRSGVQLGMGVIGIVLSLLPAKLLNIIELFGFRGDRHEALQILMQAGGWSYEKEKDEPSISVQQEGVRRSICDLVLLIFHLVLSSFTFAGVNIAVADKVLKWNLKRYPDGVLFLFAQGRLRLTRSQPDLAMDSYAQAVQVQDQYRNLHHISAWEIAISSFAMWEVEKSLASWRQLEAEATWSKACYAYGIAVSLLVIGGDENKKDAIRHMERVPKLRQKIAGKSIPLEKFIARKARKFADQGNRLALPGLELAYIFLAVTHAPQEVVFKKMLPQAEAQLQELKQYEKDPKKYMNGKGYWDDYCLAKFLEGVCLRFIAYPDTDAVIPKEHQEFIPRQEAEKRAVASLKEVLVNGPKIVYDHHLVYHAHYELGRLAACMGDEPEARREFGLVLSGKPLEVNKSTLSKGKYSMENALVMRTSAAVEALDHKEGDQL